MILRERQREICLSLEEEKKGSLSPSNVLANRDISLFMYRKLTNNQEL